MSVLTSTHSVYSLVNIDGGLWAFQVEYWGFRLQDSPLVSGSLNHMWAFEPTASHFGALTGVRSDSEAFFLLVWSTHMYWFAFGMLSFAFMSCIFLL